MITSKKPFTCRHFRCFYEAVSRVLLWEGTVWEDYRDGYPIRLRRYLNSRRNETSEMRHYFYAPSTPGCKKLSTSPACASPSPSSPPS